MKPTIAGFATPRATIPLPPPVARTRRALTDDSGPTVSLSLTTILMGVLQLAFVVYFIMILIPRLGERTFEINLTSVGMPLYMTFAAFVGMSLVNAAFVVFRHGCSDPSDARKMLIIGFLGLATVMSAFSSEPARSAIYLIGTGALLLSLWLCWLVTLERRSFWFFDICAVVYGILLSNQFVSYGVSYGRYIGNLTPNHFCGCLLAAVVLASFGAGRVRMMLLLGLSLPLVLATESRGGATSLLLYFGIYGLSAMTWVALHRPQYLRHYLMLLSWCITAGLVAVAILMTIMPHVSDMVFAGVDDFYAMSDPNRGLGSGVSGRSDYWQQGLEALTRRPATGIGFRMMTAARGSFDVGEGTSHNAFLDLFAELGLFTPLLLIAAILLTIQQAWTLSIWAEDHRHAHFARVVFAATCTLGVNGFFEIHLINLGFPQAVVFAQILMFPLSSLEVPRRDALATEIVEGADPSAPDLATS
jgi:hypothetical protein